MVFGFPVLGHILLVLVGGSKGGGPAQKLMRELGFMVGDLEGRWKIVRRYDFKALGDMKVTVQHREP